MVEEEEDDVIGKRDEFKKTKVMKNGSGIKRTTSRRKK